MSRLSRATFCVCGTAVLPWGSRPWRTPREPHRRPLARGPCVRRSRWSCRRSPPRMLRQPRTSSRTSTSACTRGACASTERSGRRCPTLPRLSRPSSHSARPRPSSLRWRLGGCASCPSTLAAPSRLRCACLARRAAHSLCNPSRSLQVRARRRECGWGGGGDGATRAPVPSPAHSLPSSPPPRCSHRAPRVRRRGIRGAPAGRDVVRVLSLLTRACTQRATPRPHRTPPRAAPPPQRLHAREPVSL